jgi:hypothetical protein
MCCRRTRFLGGAQLRVRWAQVVLDDADLAAPSILTVGQRVPKLDEERWARALMWVRAQSPTSPGSRPGRGPWRSSWRGEGMATTSPRCSPCAVLDPLRGTVFTPQGREIAMKVVGYFRVDPVDGSWPDPAAQGQLIEREADRRGWDLVA